MGSESGGGRAAILLSLIASAKHCGVEPWVCLNAVFCEMPLHMALSAEGDMLADRPVDLSVLLPDVWLKSHPEHRWQIDDIREEKRAQSRQQKILKR